MKNVITGIIIFLFFSISGLTIRDLFCTAFIFSRA
jgi:hypothetical protein